MDRIVVDGIVVDGIAVKIFTIVFFGWLLSALPAAAEEKILSFHSDIIVRADGTLEVTETIKVRAEGREIRRGIYRDFPTRYDEGWRGRVVVGFEPLEVLRDGKREPWFRERVGNGVRINFGDNSFLPVPLETTYTLRYQTDRQLGFFENHDELYWNVTGTGWIFPIDRASARVQLPQAVPADQMRLDFYTGPQGSRGQAAFAEVLKPGLVEFTTAQPLGVREGLTLVVGFPKGMVQQPGLAQRLIWLLRDNWVIPLLLAVAGGISGFYFHHWRSNGRDPARGPIFPRYSPPEGFSPGTLRYLYKQGAYSGRCMAADLVFLAIQGCLEIRREKKLLRDTWILEKRAIPVEKSLADPPRRLWGALFKLNSIVETTGAYRKPLGLAKKGHRQTVEKRIKPRYFIDNGRIVTIGGVMTVGFVFICGYLTLAAESLSVLLVFVVLLLILVGVNVAFALLLRRPTAEGRKLLDYLDGLRLYLRVANQDELAQLQMPGGKPPLMNPEHYQSLLPYAIALEVEDAWAERLIQAVGAAAATESVNRIGWYRMPGGVTSLASISSGLGNALSASVSSSSSSPGRSSGGGGGGSSGGGGGGGGGGGR